MFTNFCRGFYKLLPRCSQTFAVAFIWRSLSDKYHSRQLKVLWTTGGALDKWRYFGQLLVLLADGDTSDWWRSPRQLEVLRITAPGKRRYFRLLGVPSTTEGTLDSCSCSWLTEILPTDGALDSWRYFGQLEVISTNGGTLDNWRCSRQLEVFWTTGGTLDNWRCSRQMEVLSTTRGTLDNRRYFGQLEVLWRTVGTPDKCPGQLEVLSMTGDPMMLCDHKVQSNPAGVRSKFLWGGGEGVVDGEGVAVKDAWSGVVEVIKGSFQKHLKTGGG